MAKNIRGWLVEEVGNVFKVSRPPKQTPPEPKRKAASVVMHPALVAEFERYEPRYRAHFLRQWLASMGLGRG